MGYSVLIIHFFCALTSKYTYLSLNKLIFWQRQAHIRIFHLKYFHISRDCIAWWFQCLYISDEFDFNLLLQPQKLFYWKIFISGLLFQFWITYLKQHTLYKIGHFHASLNRQLSLYQCLFLIGFFMSIWSIRIQCNKSVTLYFFIKFAIFS